MLRLLAVSIPLYYATSAAVGGPVGVPPADTPTALHSYAAQAVARNTRTAAEACARLRANGPAGLDALLEEHKAVLAHGQADPNWGRVTAAIDKVAAQKDAYASRLYWYTDLEQAKAAARASGKPILSLRTSSRLDAGSSRTQLYKDPKVSALLRERFVLHWENDPATSKVTLDLGAGQSLEKLVQGDGVHLVLDADGRAVDAIDAPTPANAFRAELAEDADLERSLRGLSPAERATRILHHHALRRGVMNEEWPAFMVDAAPGAASRPAGV